ARPSEQRALQREQVRHRRPHTVHRARGTPLRHLVQRVASGNTRSELTVNPGRPPSEEPMMEVEELAQAALLMATLPPHVNMLHAIVLPVGMPYLGRG